MANIKSVKVSEVALLQRAALRWYSDEDQLCAILYTPLSEIPSLVTHNGATWYDRDALLRHFQGPRSLVDPATNVKWRRKLKAAKLTESAESALAHCYLDVDDLLQKIMSSRSYEDITLPNSAGAPRALDHNVGSFLSSTKMSQCEAQPQCKDKLLQVARERLAQMEDTKTRRAVLAFAIKRAGRILRQSATQQGSAGHSAAQSQRQRSKAKIDSMDFSVILETKALCVLFDPAGNALLTAEDAKPIESAEKESFSSLSCKASVKNGAEGSSIARVRNVKKEHFFTDRKLANKKKKMKRVREECRMRQAKKQELLFPGSSNSSCSRSSSSSSAQPQMKRADNGQAHGSAGSAQEESGGHARKKPRLE
ncbi:unnamed protein product [Amoebophrya sp. A25]|nr:unnamed protein product [Amoebophrya sp. A25]|eukprot:GSA25T00000561001.1